jgi:RND family efflux transporter MFP subunit
MSRRNSSIKAFYVLTIVLGGVLAGCANERPATSPPPETVSNIPVIVAQRATLPDWVEAVGTVRATQTSQVSSQLTGNIIEIQAREGDRVQGGQVLAILDDAHPRAAMEQATAALTASEKEISATDSDLALATTTLKRYEQLYEKKSVSPQEFDEIKARYHSAESRRDIARAGQVQANAALTQARTSLAYTRIRAPFAGVVTEKKIDAGMLATPGLPMFTIEDTRRYRLEVTVDEIELRTVRNGQVSLVMIDAVGNVPLTGKVVQIIPAVDVTSRGFLVKVELPPDAHLRSGLFGRAHFPRGERSALLIPYNSLVTHGQLQGVYVLDTNQIAGLRYVTVGKNAGEQIEILSGLQEGEKLVSAPGDRDLGGKRIAPRP